MTLQFTPRLSNRTPRFPNRIREFRLRSGLTQQALAQLIHASRTAISAWEAGERFPNGPAGLWLAKALSTFLEHLYDREYVAFHPHEEKDSRGA